MSTLLLENLLFLISTTSFLTIVGWSWRNAKPFDLPQPLPPWFRAWFLIVLIVGLGLPLIAIGWGVWQGNSSVLQVLIPYFMLLGLQILTESIILRQFHSIVWVMVPYLYLPYRLWQLYQSLMLPENGNDLLAFRLLLQAEIVLWILNYGVNLLLLPWLLRWHQESSSDVKVYKTSSPHLD